MTPIVNKFWISATEQVIRFDLYDIQPPNVESGQPPPPPEMVKVSAFAMSKADAEALHQLLGSVLAGNLAGQATKQ
jgi:hypothetical protein